MEFPHSLGLLYSAFTAFLGFEVNEGEYKVMGMAPYGQPRYVDKVWKLVHQNSDGSFWLDMDYFSFHHSTDRTFNGRFVDLFGEPRPPKMLFFTTSTGFPKYYGERPPNYEELSRLNQHYADIASSIQRVTEEGSIVPFRTRRGRRLVDRRPPRVLALRSLLAVMVWRWVRKGEDATSDSERSATSLALILWLMPVVAVVALGLVSFEYDVRYVAFCIAPYYVLVAAGICRLRPTLLKQVIAAAVLCYSGYALRANYFIPYKENYRDAVTYISQRQGEGDCYARVPFGVPLLSWAIYTSVSPARRIIPGQDESSWADCRRIWVVTY